MRIITAVIILGFSFISATWALPFQGSEIAISAASPAGVQAAVKIAESGGNVVDVAVTLVLAMSVTNPTFAAMGGGGFALVKMGKNTEALDFRERAPMGTNPDYFKSKGKDASMTGGSAVAVPGLPAGLFELHKRYGKLKWNRLFEEAILLAQKGFRVSGELSDAMRRNAPRMSVGGKTYFLKPTGDYYKPGEILVQKNLARFLTNFKEQNIAAFYSGAAAKDIVDSVKATGGDMTIKDLEDYHVIWRTPMTTNYAGYKLDLMPPPSSGGIVTQIALKLIEKLDVKKYPVMGVDEYHLLGQILSRAFRDRSEIADPDHFKIPLEEILSDKNIEALAKTISLTEATTIPPNRQEEKHESSQTTHLSVLDKFGNAVAMTITLNGDFGSAVATEKFGIMLNNEMDDFTTRPGEADMFGLVQGQGNTVAPGKRPLSSMSLTLVEKNGKVVMALGAPGGPRIISSVIQALYRVLGREQALELAVIAPRVHHQLLPNKLFIDAGRFSPEVVSGLKARKNLIEESWQARVYAVRNVNGILEAVVDTRGEGLASGY